MTVDAITSLRGDARPRELQVTQLPAVVSGALSVQFLSPLAPYHQAWGLGGGMYWTQYGVNTGRGLDRVNSAGTT
jgi:hypothetical protein